MTAADTTTAWLDCATGQRLGCRAFCCRLLVRLSPAERQALPGGGAKSCLDKAADGYCVHLDRACWRCRIWASRPQVCREYDCNQDPLLPVVLRTGIISVVQAALLSQQPPPGPAARPRIPAAAPPPTGGVTPRSA